ncbi:hypothetical protein BHE74_00024550 [Ensete ventricosum]|nr:hypothetical protein BHE74_00024550 [Ensete ventricosum]RZS02979.1 hypothetical protein BHM03_00033086 [Ensete ventricosum]
MSVVRMAAVGEEEGGGDYHCPLQRQKWRGSERSPHPFFSHLYSTQNGQSKQASAGVMRTFADSRGIILGPEVAFWLRGCRGTAERAHRGRVMPWLRTEMADDPPLQSPLAEAKGKFRRPADLKRQRVVAAAVVAARKR